MKYVLILILLTLAACANDTSVTKTLDANGKPLSTTYSGVDANYAYYADARVALVNAQQPLFELKAQPGQTIELKGVESLRINAPSDAAASLAAPQRDPTILEQSIGLATALVPYAQIAGNVMMNQENQETSRFVTMTNANRDTSLFNAFGASNAVSVTALRDVAVAQAEAPPGMVTTTTTTTTINDSFNHTEDNDTDTSIDVSGAVLVESDANTVFSPTTATTTTTTTDDGDDCTNADCSKPLPPEGD